MPNEPTPNWRTFQKIHEAAEPLDIRCRRIIEGKTYNTETATLLGYWNGGDLPIVEALYQSRHGAFFLYSLEETRHTNDPRYERIIPLEPQDAQKWMEQHSPPEVIERIFGEMPEAGEAEARITLRLPETLRKRLAALAEERGHSLNAWILRCLEMCTSLAEGKRR